MQNKNLTSVACLFLIFLLLSPASPICRQGSVDECRKAALVPGFDFAGKAFDINELTLKILYEEQTVNRTCTLCENPLLEGKPFQRLPLVINNWEAKVSCQKKVQHSVHRSALSVAREVTNLQVKNDWMNDLDMKMASRDKVRWILAGSLSKMTNECIKKSSEDRHIYILLHITCTYYKFNVSQNLLLTDDFKASINDLPAKYDASSKSKYTELIRLTGTHWINEFDLGAQMREVSYLSLCGLLLEDISISEIIPCLKANLGINFGLDGLTNRTHFLDCKGINKKNLLTGSRLEIEGGQEIGYFTDNSKEWLEKTKLWPGFLFSSLKPLHTLLDKSDPRRGELKKAVSEYVKENALWRDCTKPCPPDSQRSASDFCACECPNNNFTSSRCCAQKRGLGKLIVTIEYAKGLWGDIATRSDAYVIVSFDNRKMRTQTVWNNNNPAWNANLDFGVIQLNKDFNRLQVEVWDEDSGWDDDRLGECTFPLESGTFDNRECNLRHGQMHFKYHLVCGHNLSGVSCWNYFKEWFNTEYSPDYYHYLD